jgi:hypothetical protein
MSPVRPASAGIVIDGTISSGEWDGATTATIQRGGTAYFKADTNYVYAALLLKVTSWDLVCGKRMGQLDPEGRASSSTSRQLRRLGEVELLLER